MLPQIILFITIHFVSNIAYAITHPSCITETQESRISEESKSIKPKISFEDKELLTKQTEEHRQQLYLKLIENKIPKKIAQYVYKLNFIERPTTEYKNQPEAIFTIDSYASRILKKTPVAQKFLKHYEKTLKKAEAKYQVDKEAIVALMLLESGLGKNKGNLDILNALFTMSHEYNSSRSAFFTNELVSAFKLLSSNKHYFRNNTVGSWAGAMGFVQFIPSSVLAYAVDGNNDGIVDIINNKTDAIYSAANYLHHAKWQLHKPIMEEINSSELIGIDVCKDLNKPYKDGILHLAEVNPQERYFIRYENYNTILRWNRSFVFAYTVQQIITELKK